MKMHKTMILFRPIIIIAVCCQFLLFGCVSLPTLSKGRPSDAVKELLMERGDMDTMSPIDLETLCSAYLQLKDYSKIFACFDSAQKKIDQGEDKIKGIHFAATKNMTFGELNLSLFDMRSTVFLELGRFDEAIKDALKGLDYMEKHPAPSGEVWLSLFHLHKMLRFRVTLGIAYARSNQPDKARSYVKHIGASKDIDLKSPNRLYQNLLDSKVKNLKCSVNVASSLIYSAIGDYQLALDHANKYDECNRTYFSNGLGSPIRFSSPFAEIVHNFFMGRANADVGKGETAKKYFDLLLGKEQIAQNRDLYWVILFERGRISEIEGKSDEAVRFYSEAVDVIEEARTTLSIEANKIGYAGDKQKVYAALVSLLFQEGKYSEALEYVERGKARALVDMLASKKTFTGGKMDHDKLTTLLKELDEAEAKSISLAYQPGAEAKTTAVRSLTLAKKAEIAQTSKELASLVSTKQTLTRDIQALLSPEETLVEYYYHGDDLFAFIVTPGTVTGLKLDGRGLNNDISTFRQNILDTLDQTRSITIKDVNPDTAADKSGAFRSLRDSGRTLYKKIFEPLEPMIATKNVTIVPHEALHYVPFNALITNKGYLLDTYAIRLLPSASVLQFLQAKRSNQIGDLIAFGNPDLNDPKLDLPFAQSETLAITRDNPKAKVLLRKQASKTAVKKFSDQFRYVHFACHGIFNPDKPLDSGLMLSSDDQNSGILTVNELYDLHLNADLVTLSACETALGKISNGDDVIGFTRGFLYAGTNSIVSSLWKVSDEATSLLMQEFYRNLQDRDKGTALRLAQLKVKDTYNSHPFFWAAFQLTGSRQ